MTLRTQGTDPGKPITAAPADTIAGTAGRDPIQPGEMRGTFSYLGVPVMEPDPQRPPRA